jgi:hypothetical protein
MGGALPNGNDLEVIGQLNVAFSDANFDLIRKHAAGDDFLWGKNKRLSRAAYRLRVWPTAANKKPRKRWFAFLDRILSANNQQDIKDALKKAVQNDTGNVIGIHFWAQYDPNVAPNSYVVVVSDDPADAAGNIFRRITLLTDHEIPSSEVGDPDPGPDTGEKPPLHPIDKKPKKKAKKTAKKKSKKARSSRKSGR